MQLNVAILRNRIRKNTPTRVNNKGGYRRETNAFRGDPAEIVDFGKNVNRILANAIFCNIYLHFLHKENISKYANESGGLRAIETSTYFKLKCIKN